MSKANSANSGAQTAITQSYLDCYQARRRWIELSSVGASGSEREAAHVRLDETVMSWFETLLPYVSGREDEAREYWESAPLWPVKPVTRDVVECVDCGKLSDPDDALSGTCPSCDAEVRMTEIAETDDAGNTLYYWRQGLKHLVHYVDRTEIEEREVGNFDKRVETVETAKRLDPDILLRVARHLDNCARELDLLADTADEIPVGEL